MYQTMEMCQVFSNFFFTLVSQRWIRMTSILLILFNKFIFFPFSDLSLVFRTGDVAVPIYLDGPETFLASKVLSR